MTARVLCADKGGGRGHVGGDFFARVCAQNYSAVKFIAPIWGPIPIPSPALGPTGVWKGNIRRSCRSMTSLPRFRSGRWTNHVYVKWIPRFFPPWVSSKLLVWLYPTYLACHPLRVKMEKNASVDLGSAYCDYPSFTSTNKPVDYPLDHTCRYPLQNLQIWH